MGIFLPNRLITIARNGHFLTNGLITIAWNGHFVPNGLITHCIKLAFSTKWANQDCKDYLLFQGQLSENPLEAMHKILRFLLKWRARPFLIEGLTDAYNHLWIKSSYYINSFSGEPKKKLGPMPMATDDDRYVASFIIQDWQIRFLLLLF